MRILFLHGLESNPGGSKVKYLEGLGHDVLNPWLPPDSFKESLDIAQVAFDKSEVDVVVGSSRGGAIVMAMKLGDTKVVLIAPAYKRFDVTPELDDAVILHSRQDDIIPIEDSFFLVDNFNVSLRTCGTDHRMSDPDVLRTLGEVL